MKSLLEHLIQILTEAPMSDEDRRDSEQLRQIFNKRQNRSNAKLTPSELDLLAKYNINLDRDVLVFPDKQSQYIKNGYFDKQYMGKEMNLADKLRKAPERRDSQRVNRMTSYIHNSELANEVGKGGQVPEDDDEYNKWSRLNYQEKERLRNAQDDKYRQATQTMKSYLWDREWNEKELDNYYQEKDKIDQDYRRRLNDLNRRNERNLERRDSISKEIDAVKNQFKK